MRVLDSFALVKRSAFFLAAAIMIFAALLCGSFLAAQETPTLPMPRTPPTPPMPTVPALLSDGESGDGVEGGTLTSDLAVPEKIDPEVSYENFVTKEDFEKNLSGLAWKKGDFSVTPYGFIWVNAAFNSAPCVSDSYCLYNFSGETNESASSAVDARTSRLGAKIDGPTIAGSCYQMRGVVEIDFQGAVNMTRNKGQVQFRKGFVELVNEANETKLQFGQDWDTISPLAPQMLNYLPAGFAGNIGYRRAQMRFEKGRTWSSDLHTLWSVGLADPFPGDFFSTSCVSANSGSYPIIEARTAVSFGERSHCGGPVTLGVSGHIGENTYIFAPVAGSFLPETQTRAVKHLKTWSFNVDADIPLNERIRLQGEYFLGENLSGFCGGINQGVDLYTRESVGAQGGWLSLHTKVTDKLTNNTGCGIDQPFEEDLVGNCTPTNGVTNARTKNALIFTNFLYQWNKAFMTGLEFGYWKTEYRKADVTGAAPVFSDMAAGENFRVEFATQYLF